MKRIIRNTFLVLLGLASVVRADCPFCEAFDNCLDTCATARHETLAKVRKRTSPLRGADGHLSRFCIFRCREVDPGQKLDASFFQGPEPKNPEGAALSSFSASFMNAMFR